MATHPRLTICVLLALFANSGDAQEYVSRKIGYQPDAENRRLMVAVSDESHLSLISRLTGDGHEIRPLQSTQEDELFDDTSDDAYRRLNERALSMRTADILFVTPRPDGGIAKLWHERLANHGVKVIELRPVSARNGSRGADSLTRQVYLSLIHLAASERETIDANFRDATDDIRSKAQAHAMDNTGAPFGVPDGK